MDHCLTCLGASPHLLLLPIFSIRISYFTSCLISFLRSASPPHICMFLRLSEPSPGARVVLRKLMHLPFFSYFPLSNHQFDHQPVFLRKKMLRWWDCEMLRWWDGETANLEAMTQLDREWWHFPWNLISWCCCSTCIVLLFYRIWAADDFISPAFIFSIQIEILSFE